MAISSSDASCTRYRMEIVVVGDGITVPVEQLPPAQHPVRVIELQRRSGSAAAMNAAMEQTTGRYIGRMDADDVSFPGRIDRELDYLEAHPATVAVGGGGTFMDPAGRKLADYPAPGHGDVREIMLHHNPIIHSSLVIRRDSLEAVHGYDVRCIRMQDYDLLLRLALIGEVHGLGDDPLIGYRVHDGQTSRVPHAFVWLMRNIHQRRVDVAQAHFPEVRHQLLTNLRWSAEQLVRYSGLRKPNFERIQQQTDAS